MVHCRFFLTSPTQLPAWRKTKLLDTEGSFARCWRSPTGGTLTKQCMKRWKKITFALTLVKSRQVTVNRGGESAVVKNWNLFLATRRSQFIGSESLLRNLRSDALPYVFWNHKEPILSTGMRQLSRLHNCSSRKQRGRRWKSVTARLRELPTRLPQMAVQAHQSARGKLLFIEVVYLRYAFH